MLRVTEDFGRHALFDDLSLGHDQDVVADVFDDGEVVRDEEVGEAEFFLQVLQEVDDFRLDVDVERGDRFVADDELGLDGEGARDANALALAAGELMRVPAEVFGG